MARIALVALAGYYDITAAMTGTGFTMENMAAGEIRSIGVQFSTVGTQPSGSARSATLALLSGLDPAGTEQLQLNVNVP